METNTASNFIHEIIDADLASGREDQAADFCGVFRRHVFGQCAVRREQCVIEERDIILDVFPCGQVFPRFGAAAADGQNRRAVITVFAVNGGKGRVKLLGPCKRQPVCFLGGHAGNDVFGDVIQLVQVEKRAGDAHLLRGKLEIFNVCRRVCNPPFLEVGIQKRHQVFTGGSRCSRQPI